MAEPSVETLHKKARQALEENLAEGETVHVIIQLGNKKAALIGTDRRAFIFKTGVAAGASFGQKFSSFDYRNISGVQLHHGMMTGSIVLDVAGAAPVGSSYWGNDNNDPWKAQNAVPIGRPGDATKAAVAGLRQRIADCQAGGATATRATEKPASDHVSDVAAQISAIGELRDKGLLTPEEFDAKKAELLARI